MIRPQAMEMVLEKYLAATISIFDRNKLDLGEDRTLTTLLLQAGWCTQHMYHLQWQRQKHRTHWKRNKTETSLDQQYHRQYVVLA